MENIVAKLKPKDWEERKDVNEDVLVKNKINGNKIIISVGLTGLIITLFTFGWIASLLLSSQNYAQLIIDTLYWIMIAWAAFILLVITVTIFTNTGFKTESSPYSAKEENLDNIHIDQPETCRSYLSNLPELINPGTIYGGGDRIV